MKFHETESSNNIKTPKKMHNDSIGGNCSNKCKKSFDFNSVKNFVDFIKKCFDCNYNKNCSCCDCNKNCCGNWCDYSCVRNCNLCSC